MKWNQPPFAARHMLLRSDEATLKMRLRGKSKRRLSERFVQFGL